MLLNQLYKETEVLKVLSESLRKIVKNSKVLVGLLPAVIGLLPVAGGALMSARVIETEAHKLGLGRDKKTYLNVWFRHLIFPVYPLSELLILTTALTGVPLFSLIMRQVPVVITMLAAGYLIGLHGIPVKYNGKSSMNSLSVNLKSFLKAFSPILATIAIVVALSIDISLAAFIGVAVLILIAKPSLNIFANIFKNRLIYEVTLTVYAAMLLKNTTKVSGISELFGAITSAGVSDALLLLAIPSIGFLFPFLHKDPTLL